MAKTDKELATEITIAYIESWNAKNTTVAIQGKDIPNIIEGIYNTLSNLEDK